MIAGNTLGCSGRITHQGSGEDYERSLRGRLTIC